MCLESANSRLASASNRFGKYSASPGFVLRGTNRFKDQDKNIKKLQGLLIEIKEPITETLRVVEIIYNKVESM